MEKLFEVKSGKLRAIVQAGDRIEAKRIFANCVDGHGGSGKITVKEIKA